MRVEPSARDSCDPVVYGTQAVDVSLNQIPTLQGFQSTSLSSLKISGKWCCTTFQWFKVGANTQGSLSPDNVLENLAGLSGLPSLLVLEASRNNIEDLSSLSIESAGSKLERLELVRSSQSASQPPHSCVELTVCPSWVVVCSPQQENKLTSLNGIESLPALSSLAVQHNLVWSPLFRTGRQGQLSSRVALATNDHVCSCREITDRVTPGTRAALAAPCASRPRAIGEPSDGDR